MPNGMVGPLVKIFDQFEYSSPSRTAAICQVGQVEPDAGSLNRYTELLALRVGVGRVHLCVGSGEQDVGADTDTMALAGS